MGATSYAATSVVEKATQGSSVLPQKLEGIEIKEKLGEQLSIQDLKFTNEAGQLVSLSSYFQTGKPVILSFAYYECPSLCGIVLNALTDGMKGMDWVAGNQFQVVNVSINPKETSELAAQKKKAFVEALGKPEAASGWHFLVGEESQIQALAAQVGYGYRYDEATKEYLHGAGVFVLTPEAKISRILYGIQYRANDMKLSLVEASNGKVGTILDRIILFCYSYDPVLRKYSVVFTRVMQLASIATTLIVGIYMLLFWKKQRLS
jgi:protein SCO1/2